MKEPAASLDLVHRIVPKVQGIFYLATGLWPVFHLRSFERVTGPKSDGWLVKTVGVLLGIIGALELGFDANEQRPLGVLGATTACALGGIDVVYVARKRIGPIYLVDALVQALFVFGWSARIAKRPRERGLFGSIRLRRAGRSSLAGLSDPA